MTALVASTGHLIKFTQTGGDTISIVMNLVIFTVPGVIIGGQIGSIVASHISQKVLERSLGTLFIVVAIMMLGNVLF